MEITGSLGTVAIVALVAAFLVEALKRIPELDPYQKYIPIPLAIVMIGVGIGWALLNGLDPVQGGAGGLVAAALAAFGFDSVSGIVKGRRGE